MPSRKTHSRCATTFIESSNLIPMADSVLWRRRSPRSSPLNNRRRLRPQLWESSEHWRCAMMETWRLTSERKKGKKEKGWMECKGTLEKWSEREREKRSKREREKRSKHIHSRRRQNRNIRPDDFLRFYLLIFMHCFGNHVQFNFKRNAQ